VKTQKPRRGTGSEGWGGPQPLDLRPRVRVHFSEGGSRVYLETVEARLPKNVQGVGCVH